MQTITKNQYDLYVFFTRNNLAEFFSEELEWYKNDANTLWGVICLDKTDNDYTAIISARDENKQIRCVDLDDSFVSLESAREWLFARTNELEKSDTVNSPLTAKKRKRKDIFIPIVKESKLNRYFQIVNKSPTHSAAKNVISEIMPHFFDVDGNFIEQFQTQFDSRLWELYLFCYFNEEGLTVNRNYHAPDFIVSDGRLEVGVEAVVVANKNPNKSWETFPSFEQKQNMPIRWSSSLCRKLEHVDKSGKRYWEHPHTQGKPFVIAIADFHETFSMTWSQNSLITFLYGYEYEHYYNESKKLIIVPKKVKEHISGEKRIPSGFFFQKDTENISAVIHSSSATVSKFNRIGKQCGFDENEVIMYRIGTYWNPDPNASKPNQFQYLVTEENSEPWSEGVSIFHNPNAKHPLPHDFFQDASQHNLVNGFIETYHASSAVFSSITMIFAREEKMREFKSFINNNPTN